MFLLNSTVLSLSAVSSHPQYDARKSSDIVIDERRSLVKTVFPYLSIGTQKPAARDDYDDYFDELDEIEKRAGEGASDDRSVDGKGA